MKRKLILLSGALFLALALTVGSFAYTFTVDSVRLEATAADGGAEIATQEPAPDQPEWEDVMPWTYGDGEILWPIAEGDKTRITHQEPDNGEHWDKVADTVPDDWSTYVYTSSKKYKTDLYTLSNNLEGEGTINGIVVYFRFSGHDSDEHGPTTAYAKAVIKTGGEVYKGSEESQTGASFVTRSYLWETNPDTGEAWTWEEIDALQAGIQLKRESGHDGIAYATQVYVEVGYTVSITEGEVPAGDLFEIAVHPEYPGDLLVNVYLTNTAALKKAYQYLNMKLYMEDSLEAGKEPDYQILSLENGVILFNIEGGVSANYTIEVIGGSYGLISDEPGEWGDGWSIIPEFYSEVDQR